jgi:hypothetical protein
MQETCGEEIMALVKNSSAIAVVVVDFPKKASSVQFSSVVIPHSLISEASRYPVLWIHSVCLVAIWLVVQFSEVHFSFVF